MNKCLCCYKPLHAGEVDYHPLCARRFFGCYPAPTLPYTRKDINKLAQVVYNNLAKGALCTILGRLETDSYLDKIGNKRESVSIVAMRVTIHEWLRKHRPLEELDSDFDTEAIVPREITKSLFKQIDIDDEDIPDDLAGRSPDDLF
jgi:hypothetical protein